MTGAPKTTVSMGKREEELRRDLDSLRERYERVLDAAAEAKERAEEARESDDGGGYNEEAEERVEKLSSEAEGLKREIIETEGVADTFKEKAEEWGGSEFTIRRLGWTETQGVRDEVNRASYSVNRDTGEVSGMWRTGMYEVKATAVAVVNGPPGAPQVESEDFPPDVGAWLYECVEEFNGAGEVGLSDFSLEEELERRESST